MNINWVLDGKETALKNNSGKNWKIWIWALHSLWSSNSLWEIYLRDRYSHINRWRYVKSFVIAERKKKEETQSPSKWELFNLILSHSHWKTKQMCLH